MKKATESELLIRDAINQAYAKRLLYLLQNAADCGYEMLVVDDGFVLEEVESPYYRDFYLPYFYSENGLETLEMLEDEFGCSLNLGENDRKEMDQFKLDYHDDSHLYLDVNKLWKAAVEEAAQVAESDPLPNEDAPPSINWIGTLSDFIKPNKMGEISDRLHRKLQAIDVSVNQYYSVDYYRNNYEDIIYCHPIDASSFVKEVERFLKELEE